MYRHVGIFQSLFIFFISSLIPLWPDNTWCMISTLWNFLRLAFQLSIWPILVKVWFTLENSVFHAGVGYGILLIRLRLLIVFSNPLSL